MGDTRTYASLFREQCVYDKHFIPEILKNFPVSALSCGRHLYEKQVRWSYIIESTTDFRRLEFLDFIADNGFKVTQKSPTHFLIYPIYKDRSDKCEGICD